MKPFCYSVILAIGAWLLIGPPVHAQSSIRTMVQDVGIDQHLGAQIPLDADVIDEQGRKVLLKSFFGDKPVILTFVYFRCPMLCTEVLNGLLKSSQGLKFQLGDDYHILSISIDPRETSRLAAEKKRHYAARYRRPGAKAGWRFLTADEDTIKKLTQTAGFRYKYEPATDQYAHASGLLILTPEGKISRYFYGIDYHPTDLRLGLVESSARRIGSPVDQFLLLCYHYDPATGQYGFVIEKILKLSGILTIAILGTYLWHNFREERRRSLITADQSPSISSETSG